MRAYCVMGHGVVGDLSRERRIEAATNVDRHQFLVLALVICFEFGALTLKFGLFGAFLRVDRNVLTGGHRHSPRDQARDPRDQYVAASSMRSRDTQYETRCRKDAVVRAQYRRAQPADAFCAVSFFAAHWHFWCLLGVEGRNG